MADPSPYAPAIPIESPAADGPGRRAPYRAPRLTVYGGMRGMTLTNPSSEGRSDMAMGPSKTGF